MFQQPGGATWFVKALEAIEMLYITGNGTNTAAILTTTTTN
jgi:hypothetical protein